MNKLSHTQFPEGKDIHAQALFALEYAVRAPSTHNSQPWLFNVTEDAIQVFVDWSRKLPEGDKEGRDIYISVGACIEQLLIALRYFGMFESIAFGSQQDKHEPVAEIIFHEANTKNDALLPLIKAIEGRFNARGPFLAQPIPEHLLEAIPQLPEEAGVKLRIYHDKEHIDSFARLTAQGMHIAHAHKPFRQEIARWMINNYSSKKDGIPGYTMLAPGPLSLVLPWLIGTFNMGTILGTLNTKAISSAAGVGIISAEHDAPSDWLKTGMLFQRASLFLNTKDIRTSVYVATIEVPEVRKELRKEFSVDLLPQFTFAIGYPKFNLRQSPRFSPKERMI